MQPILQTQTVTLNEVFGNGRFYQIPPFQRNYAWDEAQWEDLWDDLLVLYRGEEAYHYMGVVIFQQPSSGEDRLIVVDGQQRLVTFVLLALAAIVTFEDWAQQGREPEANRERARIFQQRFVGEKEPARLLYQSRIQLNRQDDPFFQEYLLQGLQPEHLNRRPVSHRLLWRGFAFFRERIQAAFSNDDGTRLAGFIHQCTQRVVFTQVLTGDTLSAYTIFETLNARGTALTPTDLLKNYLFARIQDPADQDFVARKWTALVETVEYERFPAFLRYYLNTQTDDLVRRERLFRVVRQRIRTSQDVLALLRRLEHLAWLYAALRQWQDPFWNDFPEASLWVRDLQVFRATQHIPLVMAVYLRWLEEPERRPLWRERLVQVLRMATVIVVRYLVIGRRNPNLLERAFHKAARFVMQAEAPVPAAAIFSHLAPVYPNDDTFRAAFEAAERAPHGPGQRVVKRLLLALEQAMGGVQADLDDPQITVEHIAPERSPWPSRDFDLTQRLGNLTLLEAALNREAGDRPFEEKRHIYAKSRFLMTRKIAEYPVWDADALRRRQREMARYALQAWRLDYGGTAP